MDNLLIASVCIFGTLIGSFLNVVIWRLPRGQGLGGRSHCPQCGTTLGARDLVPVASYLFLARRCRHCHHLISGRYALMEITTGLLFAWSWHLIHPGDALGYMLAVRLLIIVAVLLVVFVVDLEHYVILDVVIFPAAAVILADNIFLDRAFHVSWLSLGSYTFGGIIAAAGLAAFFFLLWLVSRGKWIGLGDVKLALLLGVALGWPAILVSTMAAFFSGTIVSIFLLIRGTKGLKSPIPFGTFLALGALLGLWYGPQVWHWYLGVIGL